MKEHFLSYEQALAVKELGFDKPCFGYYSNSKEHMCEIWYEMSNKGQDYIPVGDVLAPLKQQVFKWFRDKHGIKPQITTTYDEWDFYIPTSKYNEIQIRQGSDIWTYEQAEDACIDKLIELIKNKNDE